MIPLNLDDQVVLRRTLEEMEARIPIRHNPVSPIEELALDADLATVLAKTNEVVQGFNALVTELGLTETSPLK